MRSCLLIVVVLLAAVGTLVWAVGEDVPLLAVVLDDHQRQHLRRILIVALLIVAALSFAVLVRAPEWFWALLGLGGIVAGTAAALATLSPWLLGGFVTAAVGFVWLALKPTRRR